MADALADGATATTGGAPVDGPGYFFQPTVLTGVAEGTRIVDEEQFGPALPVIPYRDIDDVVERANATTFGLSGRSGRRTSSVPARSPSGSSAAPPG